MYGDQGTRRLTVALAAFGAVALVGCAVLVPVLARGPTPALLDLAVSATLGICAVRLLIQGQSGPAVLLGLAVIVWTLVGVAPFAPESLGVTMQRLALVPHALIVCFVIGLNATLSSRVRTLLSGVALLIAVVAGAGAAVPAFALMAAVLAASLFLGRRTCPPNVRALTAAFGVALVILDQRVLGGVWDPQLIGNAVDLTLIAAAVLGTAILTADPMPWVEPSDTALDGSGLGSWLGVALGSPPLDVSFPLTDATGSVDLTGRPHSVPESGALPVRGATGGVVALIHPKITLAPTVAATLSGMLTEMGAVAELRQQQRVQADQIRASNNRLLTAADDESRRLERQLASGVMIRLDSIDRLLDHVAGSAPLNTRLADVRRELTGLARGLDPLADVTLSVALMRLADRAPGSVNVHLGNLRCIPDGVSRTAWFVTSEAVTNSLKHAPGATIDVEACRIEESGQAELRICVADTGGGGADGTGRGLQGLADRATAAGGWVRILQREPHGTRVLCGLPCPHEPGRDATRIRLDKSRDFTDVGAEGGA